MLKLQLITHTQTSRWEGKVTADLYNTISIVAFALSGITFCFAIFLFYKLQIKSVIGDLSGKNAEKQVEEIRKQSRMRKNNLSFYVDDKRATGELQQANLATFSDTLAGSKTEALGEVTTILGETVLLQSTYGTDETVLLSAGETKDYKISLEIIEIHTQRVIEE